MTLEQANDIIAYSKQIEKYDFNSLINNLFPQVQDLNTVIVHEIPLPDFLYLTKRVAHQFQNEFQDTNNYLAYPLNYTHSVFGQNTVITQLVRLLEHIQQNNVNSLNNAYSYLQWLVGYQLQHGFYFKPITKQNEITSTSIDRLSERLSIIEARILDKQNQVDSLYSELSNQKQDLQNLINQKRDELNQLTVNLSTSNIQTNQITELLTKSTEQSSRINTLLEQQEENQKKAESRIEDIKSLYQDYFKELKLNSEEIKSIRKGFENYKDDIEVKYKFFEDRNNYLNNLIGREVGVSLFETFKQRKKELQVQIIFWQVAVFIMTGATIFWIVYLFKNPIDAKDYNLWWQAFALNTLKTIPALFLFYFTINQYRKERNFQEEYAFKSAVALTIDAYAGRLSNNVNKDKLIMNAVLSVYKTPIERNHSDRIKNQTVVETIKSLADTLVKKQKEDK